MIPQRAEQEFHDVLQSVMESQSAEWCARANNQKELFVSLSDFDYYVKIRQQYIDRGDSIPFERDELGLPIVFFYGIRVKPQPV